jgi:hypothetical protein
MWIAANLGHLHTSNAIATLDALGKSLHGQLALTLVEAECQYDLYHAPVAMSQTARP